MKALSYTLALLLSQFLSLSAQSSFADKLVVGTSITLVREANSILRQDTPAFSEWTWHKNIAVNLNKNIHIGINIQNIYTKGSHFTFSEEKNQYYIAGIFGQYRFNLNDKFDFYGEASWNIGNYCNCEESRDPYELNRLHYIGIGAGFDYALTEKLHLDVAFTPYYILRREEIVLDRPYLYHPQYILGLNYEFHLKK